MGGLTAVSVLLKQDNSDEQCWSTTKLISELVTERWTKVSLLWRNFSHSLFLYSMENLTKKKETGAWGRWLTGVRIQTNSLEKSKPSWGPSQMRCVEVIVNSHFFPVPRKYFCATEQTWSEKFPWSCFCFAPILLCGHCFQNMSLHICAWGPLFGHLHKASVE